MQVIVQTTFANSCNFYVCLLIAYRMAYATLTKMHDVSSHWEFLEFNKAAWC